MSDAPEIDLDDYVDLPTAASLSDLFLQAKIAAMVPKPTLRDMIEAASVARYDLEDAQQRLLATGARSETYQPYMRRAAILGAAANFLELVDKNQDAVRKALGGRS